MSSSGVSWIAAVYLIFLTQLPLIQTNYRRPSHLLTHLLNVCPVGALKRPPKGKRLPVTVFP
jgi:hypothetical protein